MLDKLIDFLLEFIEKIIPVYILKEYQKGVLFRYGRFKEIIEPGFHWKIPFLDDVEGYSVVTTTLTLPAQSIVTKDGIPVVIKATVKYKISDLKVFGVEVGDALDALSDVTCGVNFEIIHSRTWQETCDQDISKLITKDAKKEAKKWGD